MATKPVTPAELPRAVARLVDIALEQGREIGALRRMVQALAALLIDSAPDRPGVCDYLRRAALDPIPLFEDGRTDGMRVPLETLLATIEAYSAGEFRL